MKDFCIEEVKLYEDIIEILTEIEVNEEGNYEILYNGLPVLISGRKIVKLCDELDLDNMEGKITFRPLKNHKHCQYLIDYLQIVESDDIEVKIIKVLQDDGKYKYSGVITDLDGNEIIRANKCGKEIEAKFKVVYNYIVGEKDISKELIKISKYDFKYRNETMNNKRKGKKR